MWAKVTKVGETLAHQLHLEKYTNRWTCHNFCIMSSVRSHYQVPIAILTLRIYEGVLPGWYHLSKKWAKLSPFYGTVILWWKMKWLVFRMFYYSRRSGMCVGFAIVSMVGTNFHDSKLIKGDSSPGPNEIGPRAQVRSGLIGPRPIFFFKIFIFNLYYSFWFFFQQLLWLVALVDLAQGPSEVGPDWAATLGFFVLFSCFFFFLLFGPTLGSSKMSSVRQSVCLSVCLSVPQSSPTSHY